MTSNEYSYRPYESSMAQEAATMTFPAFRHMLALAPTEREPGLIEQRPIQPLGITAWHGETLVGLGLAEAPRTSNAGAPEVLSLYVRPEHRNRGIATRLLAELESRLEALGFDSVTAVYMSGKPNVPAIERILIKQGWTTPHVRTVTLRFTPEEAAATPWYGRTPLPPRFQIVAWTDLKPEELQEIRRSHEESPWIAAGLEPWRHTSYGFDPISSVALRYRGRIVGWVINHQIADDTVRFTCSFMRKDLSRRARIVPMYTESIERLRAAGYRFCVFVTPIDYHGMVTFLRKYCAPWAGFVAETRGASKRLADG